MIGFRFPAESGNSSLRHHVQTGSGVHPASHSMCTRGSFRVRVWLPGREAEHSPASSAEVKEWAELYLYSPKYARCSVKAHGQLYFPTQVFTSVHTLHMSLFTEHWFNASCRWNSSLQQNIIREMRARGMWLVGHTRCISEMKTHSNFYLEHLKGKDYLGDTGVKVNITLKWIIRN
jgi:hypothetical protein